MSRHFDFTTQHVCVNSTEANIFIHGYSAGHSDNERQTLLGSIPESFRQHTNIFAFWPSNHYAHFDRFSLLNIGAAGLGLFVQPGSAVIRSFGLAGNLTRNRIRNFTTARKRAEQMGALLFIQLNEYLGQYHPKIETLNLIGHSLGGRLVVYSLKALGARLHPRLAVKDVLLMAAAVEVQPYEAQRMCSLIQGRLINAYSKDDWTLLMPVDEKCMGRCEVEHCENFSIDDFGHSDYWKKLPEVFSRTAFQQVSPPRTRAQTAAATTTIVESPRQHEKVMTLDLQTPSAIYQLINDELARIVTALNSQSSDAVLNEAQSKARELLTQYQDELREQLAEMEENAEWNTFTIAFYGETGAGKSTIIETLRILLQERSKLADQQVFRELRDRYGLHEEKLQQLQQTIDQADARLDELAQQLNATLQRYEQPYQSAQKAIDQADHQHAEQMQRLTAELQQHERQHSDTLALVTQIQALIAERKRTASLWQKLLNLLRKTPEDIELGQAQGRLISATATRDAASARLSSEQNQVSQNRLALEGQLHEISSARDNAVAQLREQQAGAEQHKLTLTQQHLHITSQMAELLSELEQRADGKIIGDGSADFTRKTERYDFELDGQPFALLDVPGIEGNEVLVHDQIAQAVQTAHAVFYVTNKAAPPQTGDEQRKGTLEKIKEHLGAQTEVWTIFNKKTPNPKHSLTGRPLISNDESISLEELNKKMREQLGEHYREVFPLTALPAFLVSTDHFAPGSQNAKRRSKILEDFSADELLEKSRLRDFFQLLGDQLIRDSKIKITRANFNKAKDALDQARATLSEVQQNFAELSEKLDQDGGSAKAQLKSSFKTLKQRLEARGETLISTFDSNVRSKMYQTIDGDIDNNTFKDNLKDTISSQQGCLIQELPKAMKKEIERFQQEAKEILERFQEQAQELSDIYTRINSTQLHSNLDLRLNLDNGVKIGSLLLTIGGAIAAVLGTGGWVLAVGLAGLAFSFAKAVWGFFDSDFKKSQQRKVTEDNLRKITAQLRDSLRTSLDSTLPEMQQKVSQLEQALDAPAKQTSILAESVTRSNEKLKILSRQIDYAGNL